MCICNGNTLNTLYGLFYSTTFLTFKLSRCFRMIVTLICFSRWCNHHHSEELGFVLHKYYFLYITIFTKPSQKKLSHVQMDFCPGWMNEVSPAMQQYSAKHCPRHCPENLKLVDDDILYSLMCTLTSFSYSKCITVESFPPCLSQICD